MRSISIARRLKLTGALAGAILLNCLAGCEPQNNPAPTPAPSGPSSVAIKDTPFLPAVYTEQQCTDVVSSFPGWDKVAPLPEYDAQQRPTLWYAVIPITAPDQLADLAAVGIDVESMPIFTDDATDSNLAGQTGVVSKSACAGAEIHWAIVPGPVFNAIKQATQDLGEGFNSIILQPVPDVFADTSITYQSLHPIAYQALHDAGFAYMGVNAQPPQAANGAVTVQQSALSFSIGSIVKSIVRKVGSLTHEVPDLAEQGIGWIDRTLQGSVRLTIHLDVRNTDPHFGGPMGALAGAFPADQTTQMQRAWGTAAGQQMQLPGVTVAAMQTTLKVGNYGISTRFEGTTDANGTTSISVTKGKATGICLDVENGAAVVNDYFTRMEICSFEKGENTNARSYASDTSMNVELQNKYFNMLAQFTDGNAYLRDVAGYTPHKVSVLAGPLANLLGPITNGRAMTPCLDFPNVPLDIVSGGLVALANLIPGVGGVVAPAIAAAEVAYEVDMWMPDDGPNLVSRGVPSHEYGHFAMCSLLYDEDPTKSVQIPSLIIQRAAEGSYAHVTDQVAYLMEGWADFFAGQIASGDNYFSLENQKYFYQGTDFGYCQGDSNACWDFNYVEDTNSTPAATADVGFNNQVRRVATTLFDAFDGHARGGNDPGEGDFWTPPSVDTGLVVRAAFSNGDAHDEKIALPGPALRTLIHNWTHSASPLAWEVSEAQFFGALNTTIRGTAKDLLLPSQKYGWCESCQMFAQHDGKTCAEVGDSQNNGECLKEGISDSPRLTPAQMVDVCAQAPINGFVGDRPAATDPTSTCTFTGCPARTILVGSPGDSTASCVACGPHQVSVGQHTCSDCAATDVGAASCLDCADDQIVGGADGNSCVSCPALQIPNASRTACVSCGYRQVAVGVSCQDCPVDQIAALSGTCESCPAGQLVYGNACIPADECTCNASFCRAPDPSTAGVCISIIG